MDETVVSQRIIHKLDEEPDFDATDLKSETTDAPVHYKREIVWRNIFAMLMLHVGAVYGYWALAMDPGYPWYTALVPDTIGRLGALGVLCGSHRLWSHRAFKAKLPLRIFLMLMHTLSLQNDIYDWCRDHRLHHKFSDTDADPYNARRGFFFSHMGWLLVRKHPEVIRKGKTIDLSDVWADPVVRFQRRFYIPLVILCWGILPTYITHLLTGVGIFESFFGSVIFRYVFSLHHAWLVNSAAHLYGYQMYDKTLEPRENRLVVYASMGEGYHNYHHAFPWDYSASEHGWSKCFNIATLFIDFCCWIGLAYDRRKASEQLVSKRIDRIGDIEQKKQFFNLPTIVDYLYGFFMTYFVLIITWLFRYLINGTI